jgi:hypothetical protein
LQGCGANKPSRETNLRVIELVLRNVSLFEVILNLLQQRARLFRSAAEIPIVLYGHSAIASRGKQFDL